MSAPVPMSRMLIALPPPLFGSLPSGVGHAVLSSAARPLAPIYPPRPGAGWHYLLLASLPISSYKKYCIILDRNSWPALIYWDHVPQRLQNVPCLSGARNIGVLDRRGKHGVGSIIGRRGKHGGRSLALAAGRRRCACAWMSTVYGTSHHHLIKCHFSASHFHQGLRWRDTHQSELATATPRGLPQRLCRLMNYICVLP